MADPLRVMSIVGARPNFMKIAPILHQIEETRGAMQSILVHTGQHYDDRLSQVFFSDLGIAEPDINLNAGSGSHARQTSAIMTAFEPVLVTHCPDLLIVVGDVNSTLACSLVAAKLDVPIAHVEAGLRSFDRTMPEEINRLLTDQISDVLFTSEPLAAENLRREGIDSAKIYFVGNVMIDTLLTHRARAREQKVSARFGLRPGAYGLLTLHRPSNVDDATTLDRILSAVGVISRDMPILFPVHPRTQPMIGRSATANALARDGRLRLIDPIGYIDFLGLMEGSRIVLTDSGGVQEETTILGVPCLTLRENTERPVTVTHGTNQIVGTDPDRIIRGWRESAGGIGVKGPPPLWDGRAATRIVDVLRSLPRRTRPITAAV